MAHNIEINVVNGVEVASFAENGKKERAWHGLGDDTQIFDRPMFVAEALKACHADYKVKMQPVVALNDKIIHAMENGENIAADELLSLLIPNTKATMRTDKDTTLGLVSDTYGLVQNEDAFKFVDMFCSGQFAQRDNTPVIETCGVLGRGERVFVTAKFPQPIVIDAKRDDLVDMYVVFTTSHDGSGAVKCMVSPCRVCCNNTLNYAMQHNIGRIQFRHTSKVMDRLDLLNQENAEFAYKALNVADTYAKGLSEMFDHLRNIKLAEKQLQNIIADITLSPQNAKLFKETRNIYHEDITTRGRNIFTNMRNYIDMGVGQDNQEKGTAMWLMNGITSFYQNGQNDRNQEVKFDSIMNGNIYNKVNKALEMSLAAA